MSLISRASFSRLAGVDRKQITAGIERGTLVAGRGGMVDPKDPKNRAYLRRHGVAPVKSANEQKGEEPTSVLKDLSIIAKNEAYTRNQNVEHARKIGIYGEMRDFEKRLAAFASGWKPYILDLPRKTIPEIYAMALKGKTVQEAIAYAENETGKSTKALKALAQSQKLGTIIP
jgi:hypothetical protein